MLHHAKLVDLSPTQPTVVSLHQWTQQSTSFAHCGLSLEPTVSVGSLSVDMSRVRSEQCHLKLPETNRNKWALGPFPSESQHLN